MISRKSPRTNRLALVLCFSILVATLEACNMPSQVAEEPPEATEQGPELSTEEPTLGVIATEMEEPLGMYTLAVIVDLSSEPVTREQAQAVVNEASHIFQRLTGFGLEMTDFVEMTPEGSEQRNDLPLRYIDTHAGQLPDGILMFTYGNNDRAWEYGGFSGARQIPTGYTNHFPVNGDPTRMTVSFVHYSHRYAICGYDETRTTVISDVSVGGECRNQPGTPCVEMYGYSMCSNAVDDMYASTATYMISSSIVHEIAHPYGLYGTQDHYGTSECQAEMGWNASNWEYSSEEFEAYVGMCPYVYDRIAASYQP